MNIELTDKEVDIINKVLANEKQYDKISIKTLKEVSQRIWTDEITNSIFDPTDTCFCSSQMRKVYRERWVKKWNELKNE